jgi:hypothetical protein
MEILADIYSALCHINEYTYLKLNLRSGSATETNLFQIGNSRFRIVHHCCH